MGVPILGYVWSDDDDDDFDDSQGKATELPEPARKHLRKVESEKKALEKELAELKSSQRKSTLEDLVKNKGFDPKVANLIPKDVNAEGVDSWLEENGVMFAKVTAESQEGPMQEEAPTLDPSVVAQLQRMNQVNTTAITATGDQQLNALMKGTNSPEELGKVIAAAIAAGRT